MSLRAAAPCLGLGLHSSREPPSSFFWASWHGAYDVPTQRSGSLFSLFVKSPLRASARNGMGQQAFGPGEPRHLPGCERGTTAPDATGHPRGTAAAHTHGGENGPRIGAEAKTGKRT